MNSRASSGIKWTEIWKLFEPDEQHEACLCLIENFKENRSGVVTRRVLRRVAEGTGSRLPTVEALLEDNPNKIAATIRTRAAALLDEESWCSLFTSYYTRRKSGLLSEFLDQVGIEHDEHGVARSNDFSRPSQELVAKAVANLLRSYTVKELARYFAVLVRHRQGWDFVAVERDRLLQIIGSERTSEERSAVAQAESAAASSMEFTVLDRVLIEQVVRAAMQIEGSLDAVQVEELIETTARLSDKWYRAQFHLGFMDVLLPGRAPRFERPGDNQQRRAWYLAGVIAGLVRSHDTAGLHKVCDERGDDLRTTLTDPGGPGASIARTAFRLLLETGRITDGVKILRGQLDYLGLDFANEALETATLFIRQANFEAAKALVDELTQHSFDEDEEAGVEIFQLQLSRRRAQCLQAAGDFEGAEREYREILKTGEDKSSPDLLADIGLAKGRFRSLADVRLPEGLEERIAMRESLARGEDCFHEAVERFGSRSPKAAYALAVLGYLRWRFATEKEKEARREQAAVSASAAVSSILSSEYAAVYRELGALGQSYFMLAVARMSGLDDVQGREAMAAWQAITEEAGRLPLPDLKVLMQAAEPYSSAIADAIAESVWNYRREEATSILIDGPWMSRSPRLRTAVISIARQEQTPRTERIRLWKALIPQLIKANDFVFAEEGLSELEKLAQTETDCASVLDFYADRKNYDPVLKEADAGWARIYLLRRLGRDAECVAELRRLFFVVRDNQPWEAEQILQAAEDWNLDPRLREQLRAAMPRLESEASPNVEERLRRGESVRIVFIGGNEVQARYDVDVREEIREKWPGVNVHFEHTAWSSNWGREIDRLTGRANEADAVVLMYMMRTMLGRQLRAALKKPWIPCTSTGKGGILLSLQRAARVGLEQRGNK